MGSAVCDPEKSVEVGERNGVLLVDYWIISGLLGYVYVYVCYCLGLRLLLLKSRTKSDPSNLTPSPPLTSPYHVALCCLISSFLLPHPSFSIVLPSTPSSSSTQSSFHHQQSNWSIQPSNLKCVVTKG